MPHLSDEMRRCIEHCEECHRICLETVTHCLEKGGRHAEPSHLRLLLDCAQICHTSADFMLRGSDLHVLTCGVCAEVCERCADSCERLGDDQVMRRCAEVCRHCAESCLRMAGATVR
ncbi:MAG TPA: four-helix bundle copper-binding protein [Thermoanaerobaculia bacterium]|jgi:hypothetical protein